MQVKEKSTSSLRPERKSEDKLKVCDAKKSHKPKMSTRVEKLSSKKSELSEKKRGKKDKKRKEKAAEKEKNLENDDSEMPSMSFEEYLSYDVKGTKRMRRSCESRNLKRIKLDQKQEVKTSSSSTKSGKSITDAPTPVVIFCNYLFIYL